MIEVDRVGFGGQHHLHRQVESFLFVIESEHNRDCFVSLDKFSFDEESGSNMSSLHM